MDINEAMKIAQNAKDIQTNPVVEHAHAQMLDDRVVKEIFAELRSFKRSFIWLAVTIPLILGLIGVLPIVFIICIMAGSNMR